MRGKERFVLAFLFIPALLSNTITGEGWISEKYKGFTIHYTSKNKQDEKTYINLINNGIKPVSAFFQTPYKNDFDVFVYPNRELFDTAMRSVFNNADFKSECWLVATGDARKISLLSINTWSKESCTFRYAEASDKIKTQKLVTHELVHVFHGQINANPALNDSTGMDWFIEGLAYYVSGQLDSLEIKEVKKAILDKKVPESLDALSTFELINLKYSISGSLVLYIDKKFGRAKLKALLPFNKKEKILATLNVTERVFLQGWKEYMQQ